MPSSWKHFRALCYHYAVSDARSDAGRSGDENRALFLSRHNELTRQPGRLSDSKNSGATIAVMGIDLH